MCPWPGFPATGSLPSNRQPEFSPEGSQSPSRPAHRQLPQTGSPHCPEGPAGGTLFTGQQTSGSLSPTLLPFSGSYSQCEGFAFVI